MKTLSILCLTLIACLALSCGGGSGGDASGEAGPRFLTIGTGGLTGVYYPTGGAIARMVNAKREEYGIRCTVESTGGSVFNINALMAGDLELGIAQSDRQHQAYHGLAEWEGRPQTALRSVLSIHPEAVTLVAAVDAGIVSVEDLRGKRVNIGNPGSGHRQNALDILGHFGIDPETELQAESVKAADGPGLLQDDRIDAYFYTVGHPNGAIKESAAGRRKIRFVPITGIDDFLQAHAFYAPALIPVNEYDGVANEADVPTFGVKATLVTRADLPEESIHAVVREILTNFEDFKTLHPAFATLTPPDLLEGLSAPLHPGAERAFREAGLLP